MNGTEEILDTIGLDIGAIDQVFILATNDDLEEIKLIMIRRFVLWINEWWLILREPSQEWFNWERAFYWSNVDIKETFKEQFCYLELQKTFFDVVILMGAEMFQLKKNNVHNLAILKIGMTETLDCYHH